MIFWKKKLKFFPFFIKGEHFGDFNSLNFQIFEKPFLNYANKKIKKKFNYIKPTPEATQDVSSNILKLNRHNIKSKIITTIKAGFVSLVNKENISPMETEAAIGPNSSIELLSKRKKF